MMKKCVELILNPKNSLKKTGMHTNISIKYVSLNKIRQKKGSNLEKPLSIKPRGDTPHNPQTEDEELEKLTNKTQHKEKKFQSPQIYKSSKAWRKNSLTNFDNSHDLKLKLKKLRKFNLLTINQHYFVSCESSQVSTKTPQHTENSLIQEKKIEFPEPYKKLKKFDQRNRPARFLSAKDIKYLSPINKSCGFINPKLKQDLQLIHDNSSDNLNRNLKEEKIYMKYKANFQKAQETMPVKSVRFNSGIKL